MVNRYNPECCGLCSWDKLCTGCPVDEKNFKYIEKDQLLVANWEVAALHFKYKALDTNRIIDNDQTESKRKQYLSRP